MISIASSTSIIYFVPRYAGYLLCFGFIYYSKAERRTPDIAWVSFSNKAYGRTLQRIEEQAKLMNVFTSLYALTETDLEPDFWLKHQKFMKTSRGFGYWIWKPQILIQTMEKSPELSYILYTDAGCTLNLEGIPRLNEYISLLNASNRFALGFQILHAESTWTKADVMHLLNYTTVVDKRSMQVCSTTVLFVNCHQSREFVRKWKFYMESDYHNIDDSPSKIINSKPFSEHRHDQSIFSIMMKQHDQLIIPDETYWDPLWSEYKRYPIHATRIRG